MYQTERGHVPLLVSLPAAVLWYAAWGQDPASRPDAGHQGTTL